MSFSYPYSSPSVEKKSSLISFTKMSKFHILPFLVPIFCMITTYIQEAQIKSSSYSMNEYKLQSLLNIFISKTFAIIFYFISLFISKPEAVVNEEEKQSNKLVRRYHLNVNSNNKKKIFGYIALISLLNVIFKVEGVSLINVPNKIEIKLGFVIMVPIFSRIILGFKIYEHHFFSLCLTLVGFIFLFVSLFVYNSNPAKPHIQIIHLIFSLPFSLSLVLIKYLFLHYFISPFVFLFFDGIFCIVYSLIYIILESLIYRGDSHFIYLNFKYFFNEQSGKFYLLTLFTLLFSFLYQVTNALTLYYFTPTLLVMTDILSPFTRWILELWIDDEKEKISREILFKGIGFFIIIISSFIFNEIVVLNVWKFNVNTHENIEKRGKIEAGFESGEIGTDCCDDSYDATIKGGVSMEDVNLSN